jgi:hypothetical protein
VADKKWLIAVAAMSTLGLALPSFAQYGYSGVYLGGQFGYGNTHYDDSQFKGVDTREDGAAGRLYLGNQFNPYIALELGGTIFSYADLDHDYGDVKTWQLDLLFRFGAPIWCTGLRADVKIGAATVFTDFDPTPAGKTFGLHKESHIETNPAAGASVSYYINRHIAVDLSYLHVFGTPKSNDDHGAIIDLTTLGISYLFITI